MNSSLALDMKRTIRGRFLVVLTLGRLNALLGKPLTEEKSGARIVESPLAVLLDGCMNEGFIVFVMHALTKKYERKNERKNKDRFSRSEFFG